MSIRVMAAQIRPEKANFQKNLSKLGDIFEQLNGVENRPDVLVLPETALTGYFLEGGVRDVAMTADTFYGFVLHEYRNRASSDLPDMDIVVGFYELWDGKYYNSALYATLSFDDNAAKIIHVHRKFFLPTYGVFDEKRFVARGRTIDAFDTRSGRSAVLICEDVWHSVTATIAALKGAHIIYVISASPGREFGGEDVGNLSRWKLLLPGIADEHSIFVVYAGLVGFEGGKGFTGSSAIYDPWGKLLAEGAVLEECLVEAAIEMEDVAIARASSPLLADLESALPDLAIQFDSVSRHPHESAETN